MIFLDQSTIAIEVGKEGYIGFTMIVICRGRMRTGRRDSSVCQLVSLSVLWSTLLFGKPILSLFSQAVKVGYSRSSAECRAVVVVSVSLFIF